MNGAGRRGAGRAASAVLLLAALATAAGCDRAKNAAVENSPQAAAPQASASSLKRDWGTRLLSLVPARGDDSLPAISAVRDAFSDCTMVAGGSLSGQCGLAGGPPSQAPASNVRIDVRQAGDRASGINLTACCSDDVASFRPILNQAVIGSELICPELTFVASDSVHAYRVSAPGKRDFVYMRIERTTPQGRSVALVLLLQPIEAGNECTALAELQTA